MVYQDKKNIHSQGELQDHLQISVKHRLDNEATNRICVSKTILPMRSITSDFKYDIESDGFLCLQPFVTLLESPVRPYPQHNISPTLLMPYRGQRDGSGALQSFLYSVAASTHKHIAQKMPGIKLLPVGLGPLFG